MSLPKGLSDLLERWADETVFRSGYQKLINLRPVEYTV
jgi:hypothetical protein